MASSRFYPRGILRDPNASFMERLLSLVLSREEIPSRSDPDSLYMRRFFLWRRPRWLGGSQKDAKRLYLHCFHRSDEDPDPHDHPSDFRTLVLAGGYVDETWIAGHHVPVATPWGPQSIYIPRHVARCEDMRPGDTGRRAAEHIHRVRLLDPTRRTWTLVLFFPKRREWFFHTEAGAVRWQDYQGPEVVS